MARSSRTLLAYGSVAVLLAFLYAGWSLFTRWQENREAARAAERYEAENARKFLDQYGSDAVKITDFYASPSEVRRGEKTSICYGVLNAKTLRAEPALDVYPAVSHCVQTEVAKTTTFTLTAEGKNGGRATRSITVVVK